MDTKEVLETYRSMGGNIEKIIYARQLKDLGEPIENLLKCGFAPLAILMLIVDVAKKSK